MRFFQCGQVCKTRCVGKRAEERGEIEWRRKTCQQSGLRRSQQKRDKPNSAMLWKLRDWEFQRFGGNPVKSLGWVKPEFSPGTASDLGSIIDFLPKGSFSGTVKAEDS